MKDLFIQSGEVRPGDHLVALYKDEKEIFDYVTAYIHSALARNESCIYITGDVDTSMVLNEIRNMTEVSHAKGDLLILDRTETYSKEGKFSPDRLINMIKDMVKTALDDGYTALAITGEISWVLDYEDGEQLIIEYEWKLNEYIFNTYPVSALCRYNINRFSYEMVKNIIQLHPILIWNNKIHENPYYIPAEGFKNNEIAKYQVDVWLKNIFNFTATKKRFMTVLEKSQQEMQKLHKNMTNGIIMAFLNLLENHDTYTKDHSTNVALLSSKIADSLNESEEFKTKIYYVSLVHDLGKALIPKDILNKPGKLSDEEYGYIKLHPIYGANALKQMDQLGDISLAVRHHHERYDGKGYPDGISGDNIPLMSRIIALCDSYDAMINDRPYRKANSHEYAINEIIACSGTQFDPVLVDHFVKLFS
ncbi:MAG TPA: MEDS domain-containing protein [Clostridia bacterium]|nr:MEDS domain-containing protein [Clostridia bacterium]